GRLSEESQQTGFWDDQRAAQAAMRHLTSLQGTLDLWHGLERRALDLDELFQLASEEGDEGVLAEVAHDATRLERELDRLELGLMMSGPHDASNAILSVHAREGGTEAQDWAQML